MIKCAVIIGSNAALASGVTQHLHEDGYFLLGISRLGPAPTERSIDHFEGIQCDIEDDSMVERVGFELRERVTDYEELLVVNFIGLPKISAIEDLDNLQLDQSVIVNFTGPAKIVHYLLPAIRKKAGRVYWIGSISSRLCSPLLGAYGASKAALHAYSNVLDIELSHFGARSIYIELSNVDTGLHEKLIDAQKSKHNSAYEKLNQRAALVAKQLKQNAMPIDHATDAIFRAMNRPSSGPDAFIGGEAISRMIISRLSPSIFRMIARKRLQWPVRRFRKHSGDR